ncbi:hypothetical protein [Paenochrobactrum glaciei]|uniref:Transcriptional regulator n=1 Tax=Paenochrobactrum glaciei TaxID=486407 RepID=A0ABP3R0G8_9HYPH
MAITRKDEDRALNKDELELVTKSRHPELQDLSDAELKSLIKLMRERREKAKAAANQRRREMKGRSSPRGTTASTADDGSRLKVRVLAMAMSRLNAENQRRQQMAAHLELVANAEHALELKKAAADSKAPFNTRHAHKGVKDTASIRAKNLINPMERGRQKKAAGVAQAKRDTRQQNAS